MRLRITIAATVAITGMAGLAASAGAAPKHTGCPTGPGQSGNTGNSAWQLMDEPTLDAAIEGSGGGPDDAAANFAKNNKNGDAYLCVMPQVLPNDASGASEFYVIRDNTANANS